MRNTGRNLPGTGRGVTYRFWIHSAPRTILETIRVSVVMAIRAGIRSMGGLTVRIL
ncbi:MAG: hypothetical protein QF752_05070 [Planctomycetota bacterium]|nr:hypothetical protein [Planctomycetota bacterium]